MVLSIIGSPVFIGSDDIGRIEFLPTDMDALDARGKPTGEKLLIARTPLTNEPRNRINAHLLARDITHGSIEMHADGTAYVVKRGSENDPQRVRRAPVMEAGHDTGTIISVKHGIPFYRDSSLILADPNFARHPAINMTWFEGASLVAVLEDAHREATGQEVRVRMMWDPEYDRFATWGGKYSNKQVKARARLHRNGVTGTASVVGKTAQSRTTDEGFVDVFGNVMSLMNDAKVRPRTGADMYTVARITCGASWRDGPRVRVRDRLYNSPCEGLDSIGVRFVAIFRSS